MNKARLLLIPGLLGLAACQVGIGYGPGAPLPSDLPTTAPSTSPSTSPSLAPTASPTSSNPPVGTPTNAPPTDNPSPAPSAQVAVPFTVLLDKDTQAQQEEKTLVIDNQGAYNQFWTRHGGTLAQPGIDFAQSNVVAVYRADAAYSGLGYEITSVTQANRIVTVRYRQRVQQPGLVYLPVISRTIHAVSIPLSKQSGAYDSVTFVEDSPPG